VTTRETKWNLTVQTRVVKTELQKFLFENCQDDNIQFEKEEQKNQVNGLGTVRAMYIKSREGKT